MAMTPTPKATSSPDAPEGQQGSYDILIEAIEAIKERGIDRVMILCYREDGSPVGYLTNIKDEHQRLGLLERMKHLMLQE